MNADADKQKVRVGVVGVGLMGSAMAHRLLDQGIEVIAWDRNPEQVTAVEERGAERADEPAEVVRGADVVITMLPTAPIVLDVVEPLLGDWPETTIWLQTGSVGAAEADQLAEVARAHGVTLVDAPVSGSTHPAEEGELTILASGPDSARAPVEPVFEALGSRVLWVGEAGMGSRLKMAANHWMIAMTAALAESMHLCEAMGLDQQQFVELLDGGPLGSAYGLLKLDEMRAHDYPVGFPVRLALKTWSWCGRLSRVRKPRCPCWMQPTSASWRPMRTMPKRIWLRSTRLGAPASLGLARRKKRHMMKSKRDSTEGTGGDSPSELIDARIVELGDWRGETLARVRDLIKQADPEVVEEWKWRGVPTWEHAGIICTGETYKEVVKMTFAKGASLEDPSGLFNSSLEGNTRRAIDIHEGEEIDEKALKALIRAAVALNES